MTNELSLAQSRALHLSRILMTPVTLFAVDGEYGVLPSSELEDDEVEVLVEFDPFEPKHGR